MLECKGVVEESARRCFAEVSESRHSPLVLVGAPAQGSCSPLVRARTKCSLRADSSTLRRGESPKTAHKLDTSHPQELRVIFVSVFSPGGVTPTSKFVCVLPFPDGDARRHRDLSWFGQEKALRPAGGESLYYLAPKCLYRGEYKRGMKCGALLRMSVVLCCDVPPFYS